MATTATLIHNNAYDALIITDANGSRAHYIDGAAAYADALAVGDAQDLDNWSGDLLADGQTAEEIGEVIATNDGTTLTIVDADLLSRRREFHGV